jgi:type II restriction enzyme
MCSPSAIIKRKPLSQTARRAGWVGCNFALNRIPAEARIPIVITCSSGREPAHYSSGEYRESQSRLTSAATVIVPEKEVRERFKRVKPLKDISVTQRGWTLDVLNAIRRLGKTEFTTTDAYIFERELEQLHPDNRHVRDKIRQQLQVLRDLGLLLHVERGVWRLP